MIAQDFVTVTIAYDLDPTTGQPLVLVTPHVIRVTPGQAIQFQRAGAMIGKLRVTFEHKHCFETGNPQFAASGVFHEGDGEVRVMTLPGPTTYQCELLDENGGLVAQSTKTGGGSVEPVTR